MASDPNQTVTTVATWVGLFISLCSLFQVMWTQKPWFVQDPPKAERPAPRYYEVPLPPAEQPASAGRPVFEPPRPSPLPPPPPAASDPPLALDPLFTSEPEFRVTWPAGAAMSAPEPVAWGKWTMPVGVLIVVAALLWRYRAKRRARAAEAHVPTGLG